MGVLLRFNTMSFFTFAIATHVLGIDLGYVLSPFVRDESLPILHNVVQLVTFVKHPALPCITNKLITDLKIKSI